MNNYINITINNWDLAIYENDRLHISDRGLEIIREGVKNTIKYDKIKSHTTMTYSTIR